MSIDGPGSRLAYSEVLAVNGFIVFPEISKDDLVKAASGLGWMAPDWHRIEVRERKHARPNSLSGLYGRGSFPWHTDGAIARDSPRYLMMHCGDADLSEPTEILALKRESSEDIANVMAGTALLVTPDKGSKWFSRALDRGGSRFQARWDTRACTPRSARSAMRLQGLLADIEPTGSVQWAAGTGVIIDNFTALHRRPCVGSPNRILHRRYIYEQD
ncbi:hypothetical protein GCM10023215_67210 [Pseudonocardia yuanmonensis]|uniref:TauD/TfdA-like domain-containing protein n=1 Tax=Pseudonocardia yuanmonensis TaxID=1095914 RepID=A0ABP8XT30_9PSEU